MSSRFNRNNRDRALKFFTVQIFENFLSSRKLVKLGSGKWICRMEAVFLKKKLPSILLMQQKLERKKRERRKETILFRVRQCCIVAAHDSSIRRAISFFISRWIGYLVTFHLYDICIRADIRYACYPDARDSDTRTQGHGLARVQWYKVNIIMLVDVG